MIKVIFVSQDDVETEVLAPEGISLLEAAHMHKIPLEGACEGSLACSTCHVIVDSHFYHLLPKASDDEEDMLDLAFGLSHTSRLGCQIILNPSIDGIKVRLPKATRNLMVK